MTTLSVIIGISAMIVSLRYLKDITISLLIAIVAIGTISLIKPMMYYDAFVKEISDWNFWKVMITIFSIYLLGETLNRSGDAAKFTSAIGDIFTAPRVAISLMPATIGLLPMPGGAMFSAPMVKEMALKDRNITSEDAMVTNYWFRHSMEYFWPLYPAIVIASGMANTPLKSLVTGMLPAGIMAIVAGYLYMVRMRPVVKLSLSALKELFLSSWPIVVVIIFVILNQPGWLVVLTTSLVYLLTKKDKLKILKSSFKWKTFLLLSAVFFFKAFVETSHIPEGMASELLSWSVPTILVIIALPFIMGLMTGVTQASVGLSFPLLMSLVATKAMFPTALLAYAFAVAGVLLSPVHLCVALTTQYFSVSYTTMVKRITVPLALATAVTFITYLFITKL
ncbi:DUF401 family protein [Kosmotoga pacifica]|uniref:DUF401 family protein n=1 Tax=Kosmotoga pacifica TaxID=1330330 RepID=A0A0G2ZF95_9BACT|nr:DUF401 family protein [Kosmotoga pacifica]AKI97438.1 hypothetical protein IX53_05970 [Kosmotoga pacifica]